MYSYVFLLNFMLLRYYVIIKQLSLSGTDGRTDGSRELLITRMIEEMLY